MLPGRIAAPRNLGSGMVRTPIATMEIPMAKYGKKTVLFDDHGVATGIRFTFNGLDPVDCMIGDLSLEQRARVAAHGIAQKAGDAFGASPDVSTPADARAVCEATWKSLCGGTWNAGRTSGVPLIVTAIALVQGIDEEHAQDVWDGLPEVTQKAIRKEPRVAAKMAEITLARKKERAAKAATAPSVLDGIFEAADEDVS